jgi:hypothetical protein
VADYESMNESDLRMLQAAKNEAVEIKRLQAAVSSGDERVSVLAEMRAIRAEVLAIQKVADRKQQERYAKYEQIATETNGQSARIEGVVAEAVSEAERIISGKG